MLRAGIVGCGNIFERGYLPVLPAVPQVRIEAVCDIIEERALKAKQMTGAAQASTDPREIFNRSDIDAVFILTPTHTHADLTIQSLNAGKHVLCEKPMARSFKDTERMAAAAQQSGCRLMIGHTRRFDDRWISMLETVRGGRIGDLSYIFRSEHGYNGAGASAWQWNAEQSGGVLWDVGIHIAELFQWFFDAPACQVYAKRLHVRPESQNGGAPDGAVVELDFGPGKHALFNVSWFYPPLWAPFYASMDLVGTKGKASYFDRDMNSLCLVGQEIQFPRYSPLLSSISSAFQREISHFVHAVENNQLFAVTVPDAQSAVATVEAAERSSNTGRPEEVNS